MTEPFNFPDGQLANNAKDLLELCQQYPDDATNFLVREDLEKWLAYIGNYEAAECAANARQTDLGDRQKLEEFLNRCHALTVTEPVSAAVPETPIEDNATTPESVTTPTETPSKTSPEPVVATPPEAKPKSVATPAAPQPAASPETLAPTPPAAKTPVNTESANNEEKPSFFQVVAKFIVRILYRNKA